MALVMRDSRIRETFLALVEPFDRFARGSLLTRCWRERDSNLYGAFPVKWCFWFVAVLCSERERPFFVPSPTIRFAERAEGVKGPKW
jgi:hypothetical protein